MMMVSVDEYGSFLTLLKTVWYMVIQLAMVSVLARKATCMYPDYGKLL
jgi:hypothetical protein